VKFLNGILKSMTPSRPEIGKTEVMPSQRRSQMPSQRGVQAPAQRSSPWHAVSIVSKMSCCEAAHALRSARMLSGTAPRLPLVECDFGSACRCAYKHHSDRRGSPRRKDELTGLRSSVKITCERRVAQTRRHADDISTFDVSTYDVSTFDLSTR
jgi:hypothetical protein